MADPTPPSASAGRIAALDVARGAAIVAMVGYHLSWDLSYLALWPLQISEDPGWIVFQRSILGSFLFLAGAGLMLAHGARIRWGAFGRRLAILAAAAGAMSVGTFVLFGDAFAFFGILHAIALFSVLGLLFLRLPALAVACAGAVVIAMGILIQSDAFGARWLAWIGFWTVPPRTADLVSVFPWFGMVLLGIAGARLSTEGGLSSRLAQWRPRTLPLRALEGAGRWSLLIYLLHQLILLGILIPLSMLLPPPAPTVAQGFVQQCQPSCMEGGGAEGYCEAYCACALDAIDRDGLWEALDAQPQTAAQSAQIGEVITLCRAMAE